MTRRGFLLATMLAMIPVALILMFTLSATLISQSGMTMLAMRKNKAFYLGQAGLATAFQVFGLNNNSGHTHESDGVSISTDVLQPYGTNDLTLDHGWYRWQWNPGDPVTKSYTRSGGPETYRFKVWLPTPTSWKIQCEATVDNVVSLQEIGGNLTLIYDYMVFDNGDTSDFSRAEQHGVTGKIHANGNLFLRPWSTEGFYIDIPLLGIHRKILEKVDPANLDINATEISSAKRIVRFQDNLGNPDPGGNVHISNSAVGLGPTLMEGKDQGATGQGNAFDSYNPNWRTTAVSKYQGTVTDSELGAKKQNMPQRGALEPNGYYDQRAGLHIDSGYSAAGVSEKTFYNQSENREVTVKELDIAAMKAANTLPANGIIYSEVPVRLVNAQVLPSKLTVASQATIYTKGDFNKDNPDGTGPGQHQAASLLTSDRIYPLTSSFSDTDSYHYPDPGAVIGPGPPKAHDPPLYPGDDPDVLELNAARMDGVPSADERAWVKDPANPYYRPGEFIHPLTGHKMGVKEIPNSADPTHPGMKVAYPDGDDLLENLQEVTMKFRGTISHTRTAKMAKFDNSDANTPGITPWVIKSSYIPPKKRFFEQDPLLASPTNGPPLQPRAARKLLWHEIR